MRYTIPETGEQTDDYQYYISQAMPIWRRQGEERVAATRERGPTDAFGTQLTLGDTVIFNGNAGLAKGTVEKYEMPEGHGRWRVFVKPHRGGNRRVFELTCHLAKLDTTVVEPDEE